MFNKNPDSFDVETATVEVMRNMELYGASSMDGETDQHYMPDTTILQGVIVEMFSNLSTVVEGNCLETETDDLHWNIVNISNHKINRLEPGV